jgi:hypothetical protein
MGGNYTHNDLHFVMKVTTADILAYLGIQDSSITTWSQFVDALPTFLASVGATDIQSDMQILNNTQSYSYLKFVGFYPFHEDGTGYQDGQPRDYLYFSRTGYGEDTSAWSYLPVSTGSISYTLDGDSYTFNSFRELIGVINGAWIDENYFANNWGEEFFRTISIYGGGDATDPELIQWLRDNSTVLYVVDSPVGGEWTFNELAISDPGMELDVTGTIYNNQYTAYHFDYIDTNTDYGTSIWAMFYYNIAEPYEFYDGFIYISEDLSIPENGINYSDGWYFGNGQRLAEYVQVSPPTITLQSGEDLYNPAFISWLRENASAN